ncbi:RimK family alpha-L-glutamate ligase [Streptomyces sp. Y1]|uniref:RimK family alpha-L-glutamate ligase n=1 Tax=Streptomyces sp. Y1 TaxID=3238634 RepID=A0AB39TBN5_9ACTN
MTGLITWIYPSEDYDPADIDAFETGITERYRKLANPRGFDFRVIPAADLVPLCLERPQLLHHGEDLLATPQSYIVEDASSHPQGAQALRAIYRTLHTAGAVLLNRAFTAPDYLERDKLALIQHAATVGVPTIPTIALPPGRHARRAVPLVRRALGEGPYIVKPRELSMGVGVLRVDTDQQLEAAVDLAAQSAAGYLVQPLLDHSGDMRVYLADGRIVTSLTRRPRPGGYLANLSQGGSAEANDDHHLVADHCRRIAESLGAQWLCVDWLTTPAGPVLNEWSTAHGGFTHLPQPQRDLVADAFFSWIHRRTTRA